MLRQLRVVILALTSLIPSMVSAQAIVNYSGIVYQDIYSPVPAPNSYVIAGTFAPGFDWGQFTCVYGSDDVCNMEDNGFQRAVSDGNLFPIGSGVIADANGQFSGGGLTLVAAGTPIFLFAFDGLDSSGSIQNVAFSSSTDPSFLVPSSGSTNLNASLANIHILGGSPVLNGLVFSGGLPMPEPTSATIGLLIMLSAVAMRPRLL